MKDESKLFSSTKKLLVDNIFKHLPVRYFTGDKRELRIRCPYCNDSIKNSNSAHLYIKMNDGYLFQYFCQRCDTSGVVDTDLLQMLEIYDSDLHISIRKLNSIAGKNSQYRTKEVVNPRELLASNSASIALPPYNYSAYSKHKLDYINSRYGFNYDGTYYIKNYKIVFSFKDFIKHNKLDVEDMNLGRDEESIIDTYKLINRQYICFLSFDTSYLICRNIYDDDHPRYKNINIRNNPLGKKIYMPSVEVDLLSDDINIIMAEGAFDIIGIKEHFYNDYNDTNHIFISNGGKGYNSSLQFLIKFGFLEFNPIIYGDQEVPLAFYKQLKNNIYLKDKSITIITNTLEKDCGVPKDKIKVIYTTI